MTVNDRAMIELALFVGLTRGIAEYAMPVADGDANGLCKIDSHTESKFVMNLGYVNTGVRNLVGSVAGFTPELEAETEALYLGWYGAWKGEPFTRARREETRNLLGRIEQLIEGYLNAGQ